MNNPRNNPFLRRPDHPSYNRRARHHDYCRPARYLITTLKNPLVPAFSKIVGNPDIAEGENAPKAIISRTGEFIPEALQLWLRKYPQIELHDFIIMPDHLHLCVQVKAFLPNGLSLALSSLKGKVSSLRHNALPERFRKDTMASVFQKGFNDRIAYSEGQWQRQKLYVKDNPRRYLIKKSYPDYMLRRWKFKINNYTYIALGNILLLKEPALFVVKHRRNRNEEEINQYENACRLKIENGEIPVSPFIHPKEKALRDHAVAEGGCYIRICENGFAERQSASGNEFEMMSAGRLLLIAPAEHDTQKREMNYSYARILNTHAAYLVENHEGLIQKLRFHEF